MDIAERVIITSAGMQAIKMLGQGTPGYNEYFEAVSIFEKATEICRIRKEQTEKNHIGSDRKKHGGGALMENFLGNIVGIWFTGAVCLTGAAVVVWLGWAFIRLVRGK